MFSELTTFPIGFYLSTQNPVRRSRSIVMRIKVLWHDCAVEITVRWCARAKPASRVLRRERVSPRLRRFRKHSFAALSTPNFRREISFAAVARLSSRSLPYQPEHLPENQSELVRLSCQITVLSLFKIKRLGSPTIRPRDMVPPYVELLNPVEIASPSSDQVTIQSISKYNVE